MQSKKSLLITAVILLAVLAGALIVYSKLAPNGFDQSTPSASEDAAGKEAAPDFEMESDEGFAVSLSSLRGKPVIINCWATWCPYCIDEMPYFESAYEKYGDKVEFVMLDMTDGQRETVKLAKEHIEKNGYDFPVYYDTLGQCYQSYGVTALPTTIFVSEDGSLINIQKGALTEEALLEMIEGMLK